MNFHESLKQSCLEFSRKTVTNVSKLLDYDLILSDNCSHTDTLDENQSLYFSVPFQGKVSGEFIFGMNMDTAIELTGEGEYSPEKFEELKEEIFDTFKEILNWSAGQTIGFIENSFEAITISAPKIILGQIMFPKALMYKSDLTYEKGKISCYLYMDSMATELIESLKASNRKNKELEKTYESLIQANKAKSEFLAHMSHELRTPLNGIIGIIDLLRSTKLDDYQNRQLETISKSGELLLGIINDILEFSRIETGKMVLDQKAFGFRDMIEDFTHTMSCQIYTKGLDFHINMPHSLPKKIVADEKKIKQILTNLVGNAIKFTAKGSIELNVHFSKRNEADFLKIEVKDTGVGIPEDKQETIFQSFSQSDVSDTRKYGGSGLGLFISKSMAEKMKGSLVVESQETKGSLFSLEIPVEIDELESPSVINISSPMALCSTNQREIAILEKEIQTLTGQPINLIDPQQINKETLQTVSSLIIDWTVWNQISKNQKELINRLNYLSFFIPPNCVPDMEWNMANFKDMRYGLLLKPMLRTNLVEVIEKRLFKNEATEKETEDESLTMVEMFTEEKDGRILLVDDNAINLEVARVMLASQGYKVDVAFDGLQAVDKVDQNFYDLIIMDCQMPQMDGYEATKSIRALDNKKAEVPIIGFTANAFKEVKKKCFDSGMNDFVTKPIKKDQLIGLVKQYLES